jgi:DNA repair exonuclease SbcCD ATPase subunit
LQQVNIDDKLLQLTNLKQMFDVLDTQKLEINNGRLKVIESISIYEFWKNAFSNKGIRPLLLDAFCNGFNSIVKTYCQKVSKGLFMVEFTPTSETKKGEARNKIGINVLYKGKPTTYEALSGGESTLVNVPIAFALNKWIALKYGVPNGILGAMFLDEIFGALDRESEEKVASLLVEEGQSRFIGAITHTPELSCWTNNYWNINKENDISNIQVI